MARLIWVGLLKLKDMAASKGNQFWKLRSKHGRDKLFSTPEAMWEAAVEYFEWCDDNPLMEAVVQKKKVSRDTEVIELVDCPKKRPYTMQGLCLYLNCNTVYFNNFEASLRGKEDHISKDFNETVTRIRETIYNQKFTGAASGFFNPNIIARDLGLVDKKQQDIKVEQPLFQLPEEG